LNDREIILLETYARTRSVKKTAQALRIKRHSLLAADSRIYKKLKMKPAHGRDDFSNLIAAVEKADRKGFIRVNPAGLKP